MHAQCWIIILFFHFITNHWCRKFFSFNAVIPVLIRDRRSYIVKVHLYTARTRTRPTQTRTRLLSGFAIQIDHEPEGGKPSTDFEASRLLLAGDIKFVKLNYGAGIIRHIKDHSSVCVRKILLISDPCLLCHTVHDSFQCQKS